MTCFRLSRFLLAAHLLFATPVALANVITFDDIGIVTLPNGYQNLNWDNFATHPGNYFGTGYAAGLISSPNDAFNQFGKPASFSSITPFTFVSGYFTAAWNDGLNITIEGLNGTNVLDLRTIVVSNTGPTLEIFNWTDVTQVEFNSFGGTPNPYVLPPAFHFVLDNLTIDAVPEPGMSLVVAIISLGVIQLRRKWLTP